MSSLSELQATPGVCASPDPSTQGFIFQQVTEAQGPERGLKQHYKLLIPVGWSTCICRIAGREHVRAKMGVVEHSRTYLLACMRTPAVNEARHSRIQPCHPLAPEWPA